MTVKNEAQELYDQLWWEVTQRSEARGTKPPSEEEIFRTLVKSVRNAVAEGDPTAIEFVAQLKDVVPVHVRAKEDEAKRQLTEQRIIH